MAENPGKWPSNRGPIVKIMPSDGCKGDTGPWRWKGGTISLNLGVIWEMFAKFLRAYRRLAFAGIAVAGLSIVTTGCGNVYMSEESKSKIRSIEINPKVTIPDRPDVDGPVNALNNLLLGLLTGGSPLPPQIGYEFGVYMDAHDIKVDQIVLRQFRWHLNAQGHFELREGGDATLELIVVRYGFQMPPFDITKNMRNPFLNIRATLRSKDSTVLWSNFDFVMAGLTAGSGRTHAYRIQALLANPRLVERSLEEASCVIAYLLLSELHPVRPSSHGSTGEQLGGPICDPVVHIGKTN